MESRRNKLMRWKYTFQKRLLAFSLYRVKDARMQVVSGTSLAPLSRHKGLISFLNDTLL